MPLYHASLWQRAAARRSFRFAIALCCIASLVNPYTLVNLWSRAQHNRDRKRPAGFALSQRGALRDAGINAEEQSMQVRHILQIKGRDIIGIADSATLSEAAHILAQHHIGALLIQDSGGALAGI